MGKKKKEAMEKEKAKFLAGAEKKAVDLKLADDIFELMSKFAAYGFNKSHSAAYGLVTYQTGYLKRYFPEEFMAGLLTCDKEDTDKVVKNVAEVRSNGIEVRRPDVNQSLHDFSVVKEPVTVKNKTVEKKFIRFGLSAVKGVGEGAVESILQARDKDGAFTDLFDFTNRIDLKRVNKKVLEALIKAGAFDDLHPQKNRAAMLAVLDRAVDEAQKSLRDRESGQTNLFGLITPAAAPGAAKPQVSYPNIDEWDPKQKLANEKESLGFYISGHPLDRYAQDLKRFRATRSVDVQEKEDWTELSVAGIVSAWKEWPLKSGEGRMAIFQLEDTFGQVKVACFAKQFAQYEQVLKGDEPILVTGKVKAGRGNDDPNDEAPKVKELTLAEVIPLAQLRAQKTRQLMVEAPADVITDEKMEQLKTAVEKYPGGVQVVLRVKLPQRSYTDCMLGPKFTVTPSDELLLKIERLFGPDAARLR
jgi:DNA polymerase-3 subunit alpha